MSIKLKVRQGGASASQPELQSLGDREGVPVFDGDQPVIDMAQRWEMGQASQGSYTYVDVAGEATYFHRSHAEVKLIEDAVGFDAILGWGRMEGGNDTGRRTPTGIGGSEVEHQTIQVMDCNIDLRGLPFRTEWERPAETTWQRLQALELRSLNGSSSTGQTRRATTDITINNFTGGNHLVDASSPVDMDAHTYPVGSTPLDVMEDIFSQWEGKRWGVTIHHKDGASHKCLLVLDPGDNTTFTSALKISDHIADWDPEDLTAPVLEPIWARGAGKLTDNSDVISGLISVWGGTPDNPRHLYVETGDPEDEWETWVDVYHDDVAKNATQAERRANRILNDRKRPYVTPQPTITLLPEQVTLITAGQSIQVKSAVVNQGPDRNDYVWWRIAEIRWEPKPDGNWKAHLSLDRARNARFGSGGGGHAQPGSTSPKPAPPPVPDIPGTVLALWTWDTDNLDTIGGTLHALTKAAPGYYGPAEAAWGSGMYGRNSAGSFLAQGVDVVGGQDYTFSMDILWGNNPTWRGVFLRWNNGGGDEQWIPEPVSGYAEDTVYHVTKTSTAPLVSDKVEVRFKNFAGIYVNDLQVADAGTVTDDDEFALPDGGDSPYYARSDDPRFSADDQHIITRISRTMTNGSGGDLVAGNVVIAVNDNEFDTVASAAYADGMVGYLLEDVADGETGVVLWQGVTATSPTLSGTPVAGDFLFTSATPGEADLDATRAEGAVGKVIAVDSDDDPQIVEWWGIPDSGSGGGGSGHTIKENGTPLTTRAGLNFGTGLIATDDSGNNETDVVLDDTYVDGIADTSSAAAVATHAAASDPHTGYLLESILANKGDLIGASANDTPSLIAAGSEGQLPVQRAAATPGVAFEYQYSSPQVVFGDGTNAIASGTKLYLRIPFNCTIVRWSLLSTVAGAIVVDIWKDTFANFPPTDADSITGGNEPELVASDDEAEDTTLTGWTTALSEGDILGFNVDSATTVTRVTLELRLRKG